MVTQRQFSQEVCAERLHGNFSDARLGQAFQLGEGTGILEAVHQLRGKHGVRPVYKRVDTCAAEFESFTPYMYSTYEDEDEATPTDRKKVIILGSGPNRIGQGIEFDYCCCHAAFALRAQELPPMTGALQFGTAGIAVEANAAVPVARFGPQTFANPAPTAAGTIADNSCSPALPEDDAPVSLESLATLRPLGQVRESFILAVNPQGLWIIDQHVAHERVLFEKILRQRMANSPERQQMLMPLLVELTPSQMAVFAEISDELNHNGFEVEPFGTRTIAVKTTAAGVSPADVEHLLHEILEQFEHEEQSLNLEKIRTQIAASIACHAAIKVNMPLEQNKMEWLLQELAKTDCPMSCPHGRPVVLRYSVRDIQRAFKRI